MDAKAGLTRAMVQEASRRGHAATTVLLAQRWLREHPDDLGVLLDYAEMLYSLTRYDEAVRVYRDVLERFPAPNVQAAVSAQLGHLHRYRGDLSQAEHWYRQLIRAEPDDAGGYIFLGAVQARQGKLDEAEESHRAATRCTEGYIDEAYLNLGLVLRGQGRLSAAAKCFRRAIELTPEYTEAIDALADVEAALALTEG
jgi:tetratricopeptide (TPR) repeat protein